MIKKNNLKDYNAAVCDFVKNGVTYYIGQGFFQIVFNDGSTFQVCYDTEDGAIDMADLGHDWGVCGAVNAEFKGNIYNETRKHAKVMNMRVKNDWGQE